MKNRIKKIFAALCALVLALTAGACFAACGESEPEQPIDKIALTQNATDYSKYVNTYGRVFYNSDLGGVTFINSASGFEVRFRGTELRAEVQTVSGGGSYPNGMFWCRLTRNRLERQDSQNQRSRRSLDEVTRRRSTDGEHVVKVLNAHRPTAIGLSFRKFPPTAKFFPHPQT
ncbi:MAG: hypothetical protein ACLUSP_11355 [Christensenellales bacterium]